MRRMYSLHHIFNHSTLIFRLISHSNPYCAIFQPSFHLKWENNSIKTVLDPSWHVPFIWIDQKIYRMTCIYYLPKMWVSWITSGMCTGTNFKRKFLLIISIFSVYRKYLFSISVSPKWTIIKDIILRLTHWDLELRFCKKLYLCI